MRNKELNEEEELITDCLLAFCLVLVLAAMCSFFLWVVWDKFGASASNFLITFWNVINGFIK